MCLHPCWWFGFIEAYCGWLGKARLLRHASAVDFASLHNHVSYGHVRYGASV
jgi:hypothetical protein